MWLLLVTPDAEPLVGRWRVEHDWAARCGIPAHVTVRTPFLPSGRSLESGLEALHRLLPVDVTLARLEDRPGALVLLVEPDHELRDLTDAVSAEWPGMPTHKGGRPDVAYHVTVVRTKDDRVRTRAWDDIAPRLPARVGGTELWAVEGIPSLSATIVARSGGP
jgi:2'-5' RNA ligase superfamily